MGDRVSVNSNFQEITNLFNKIYSNNYLLQVMRLLKETYLSRFLIYAKVRFVIK